jgi:hypothetical protein
MPKEMRRLVLSDTEFREALKSFVATRDRVFNGAALLESRIVADDPLEVELTLRVAANQKDTVSLSGAHLAAAVIAFCRSRSIPLPRSSTKSVKRVSGGVALDIHIPHGDGV